jgi:hypothetical protein
MDYEVRDGRLVTRSIEVHITDHCNLRCEQCCSLSPFLPPWYEEPERLRRDFAAARRVLAPTYLKLVGGEPLLHPRLLDCLSVARESALAPVVSVTTNGLLLHRMPERFWELLNHLTLSVYPRPRLSEEQLTRIRERADRFGVTLNVKVQDQFQLMTLDEPRTDEHETRDLFETCWLRHRCHMLRDGRFFLCTRPPHFDTYFESGTASARRSFSEIDGVLLHDGPGLLDELKAYLERSEPLESCRLCYGGDGPRFEHRQLTPLQVRTRPAGVGAPATGGLTPRRSPGDIS